MTLTPCLSKMKRSVIFLLACMYAVISATSATTGFADEDDEVELEMAITSKADVQVRQAL